MGGEVEGRRAVRAEAIDCHRAGGDRQARQRRDDAGDIHSLLALWEGAPDDDVFDRGEVEVLGALDGGAHGDCGEIIGAHAPERALPAPPDAPPPAPADTSLWHSPTS